MLVKVTFWFDFWAVCSFAPGKDKLVDR